MLTSELYIPLPQCWADILLQHQNLLLALLFLSSRGATVWFVCFNPVFRDSVQAVTGYCPDWSRNLLLQFLGFHGLILSCSSHWSSPLEKKKKNLGSVLEEVDRISLSMLRASILLFHSLPKFVGFTVFLLFSISAPCLLTPSKSTGLIPKVGVFRKPKAY